MNRKSKIIVSVVGITIVLLALLGITYAYYLTRIQGNTNTNSISVTTADLKLVYGDGESELVTMTDIMPGTVIEKDFTVTNSGKSKVEGYLVVLEGVTNELARKEDLVYTLDCKLSDATSCGTVSETIYPTNDISVIFTNDIDVDVTHYYTLTVTYKNLEDIDQSEDMGKMFDGRVNIMDGNTNPYTTGVTETDNASLVYNIINNSMTNANGTTYRTVPLTRFAQSSSSSFVAETSTEYNSVVPTTNTYFVYSDTYKIDDYARFTLNDAKVIQYTTDLNDLKGKYIVSYEGYETEENANSVLENKFSEIYYIGEETTDNTLFYAKITSNQESLESTLSVAQDNLGTSYYYRGAVQDNYVLFNNMCFRIVRIEGDGSVKLIFAGDVTAGAKTCSEVGIDTAVLKRSDGKILSTLYGYDENKLPMYENYEGGLEDKIESWYNSKFISDELKEKIKTDKWCLGGNNDYKYDENGVLITEIVDDITWRYAAGNRYMEYKDPNIMCENENFVISKYGAITSDEVIFAGVATYKGNKKYYLYDNAQESTYWTLSWYSYIPSYGTGLAFIASPSFGMTSYYVDGSYNRGVRPMITLIPGTTISGGVGTKSNPYIISAS